jgi:iron(III) transport system ATP-binding protein
MTLLVASGLVKTYQGEPTTLAVDKVDLNVESGSVQAVLGPSGCGKSTLLRLLAGFARADRGTIELDGELVEGPSIHTPPERRNVGIVLQEGALFPHLSVRANVAFGLRRSDRRDRDDRVAEVLELVGLPHLGDRRPHELSGGQQQRVALARALAPRPRMILLDEPFAALDTELRTVLRQEIFDALRASRTTAVLVTHDQSEALSLADRVAVMREGKLVQNGSPSSIYRNPIDPQTARSLGPAQVLPGVATGGVVDCVLGRLELGTAVDDGPIEVMVRPEQLAVVAASEPVGVPAEVTRVRFFGPDATVGLRMGAVGGDLEARVHGRDAPEEGAAVRVVVHGKVMGYEAHGT